jgi:3-oxoacyl-[acyl-carrier-protein] synthase II
MNRSAPVITAWSAISPFGIGAEIFAAGIRGGRTTHAAIDPAAWQVPDTSACLVPGFSVQELLGKKGTRALNRATGLAVATIGRLLSDMADLALAEAVGEGTALALGTTSGSAQSMMDFTKASLTGERPYMVEPALVPNSVINVAAARCAIWHGLKGPNTTLATGRPSAISALSYARRLLATGRAERALAGAVEEYSNARAWLRYHSPRPGDGPLGEGCAIFLLEPAATAARPPLAELAATEFRVCGDGGAGPGTDQGMGQGVGQAVQDVVRAVLSQAGVAAGDVLLACPSGADDPVGQAERAALAGIVGEAALSRVPALTDLLADADAASSAFGIAAVLSVAATGAAGRFALVTSADPEGAVGCALLRLAGAPS